MSPTKDEEDSFYRVELTDALKSQAWEQQPTWREGTCWLRPVGLLLTGAMIASVLWSIGLFVKPQGHLALQTPPLQLHAMASASEKSSTRSCGTSPDEARMLGCQFQLWSYSWVPGVCFDHKLQNDFIQIAISSEGWDYYTKHRGGEEHKVDLGNVLGGGKDNLFTTWGQHYWHCVFYQRKFFSVVLREDESLDMMTSRDKDEPHALSCQRWIADPWAYDWYDVNVNLTIGYHSC